MEKRQQTTPRNTSTDWQRMGLGAALCFMAFSFVGHWLEIGASTVSWLTTGTGYDSSVTDNPASPFMIYGAGALVCACLIRPLHRRFHLRHRATTGRRVQRLLAQCLNLAGLYLVCFTGAALLEFLGHQILVARFGHNPFWDYSDSPLNFGGAVCLGNTVAFGVAATAFIEVVCPRLDRWAARQSLRTLRLRAIELAGAFLLGLFTPPPALFCWVSLTALAEAFLLVGSLPRRWRPVRPTARTLHP